MAEATAVVCTQGSSHLLGHTVRALLASDGIDLEVLVVVDGDADALAARLGLAGTRARFVSERARGLNVKRNRGIAEATTPYVMFTDDDCVPAADWAHRCRAALHEHDLVTGRVVALNRGYRVSLQDDAVSRPVRGSLRDLLAPWTIGNGNNLAVRRQVARRLGGFRDDLGVGTWSGAACDTELLYRALRAHDVSMGYAADAVVYHAQPTARDEYLRKRRMYYRGLSYMVRRAHPGDPMAWLMATARLGATFGELVLAFASLRRTTRERALAQWRGAVEGLCRRPAGDAT